MALLCPFSRGLALPRRALLCVLPALLLAQELAFSPGPATPIGETLPKESKNGFWGKFLKQN